MDAHFLKRHLSAKVVVALLPLKQKGASEMKITTIGVDLAKEVFQIHGVDAHGKTVLRKQLRRAEILCRQKMWSNKRFCRCTEPGKGSSRPELRMRIKYAACSSSSGL